MTTNPSTMATDGDLSSTPLPRLLLSLHRRRYEGTLVIKNGRSEKTFSFQKGAPVLAESNLSSETLGVQLVNQGVLSNEDHERVSAYIRDKGCREGVALLALEILGPEELFLALKDQVRRRMLEAFGWQQGSFELSADTDQINGEDVQSFRCDPLALIQEGLETHWGIDRILTDLMEHMDSYPSPRRSYRKVAMRLRADPAADGLLGTLDGTRTLGQTLGSALNSPRSLAAAWVLDAADAIEYTSTPGGADAEAATAFEAEIEINVSNEKARDTGSAQRTGARAAGGPSRAPRKGGSIDQQDALRAEIEKLQSSLADLDHYELLGVVPDATRGQIKKAYLKAAKRFHPDTLARLGVESLKQAAADVFAQIAEAFEVLSDSSRRADYDAALRGELSELDATRLAQAETSYRKGEILIRMGDFKGALEYLRPAVDLWPGEPAYQAGLGWALYKASPSDPEGAREHLQQAVDQASDDPVSHFRLGVVLRSLGETAAAKKHMAAAKQLDPSTTH